MTPQNKKIAIGGTIALVSLSLIIGTAIWYKSGGKAKLIGLKKSGNVKAKDFFTKEELAQLAHDKKNKV